MTDKELLGQALDSLEDCANLLGKTQAIKIYGHYTKIDSLFELAMFKAIAKHRKVITAIVAAAQIGKLA